MKTLTQAVLVCIMLLSLPMHLHAREPHAGDMDKAVKAGDFAGYFTNISAWLNRKAPADAGVITEAAMKALLKDPVFANTLAQRQLLSKHGVDHMGAFARAGQANRTFLAWLLRNTEAMDLYLEGATPTGVKKREADSYTLDVASLDLWRKLFQADPDSKQGLYLRLAIAIGLNPPGTGNRGAGQAAKAADPVDRYNHFKSAHQNKELFPGFDNLTVWEYRQIVSSNASNADLAWARAMINTWRPDLRVNEQVVNSTSEVWRRASPIPYDDTFKNVLAGGGKCGPRSSWAVFICQAFGIPAVGVRQPGHACAAYKAAHPEVEPQPGNAWKVVYGRGWHVSKAGGVSGPEFLEEMEARSHETEFSQGEHLRWLASTLAPKERAEAVMAVAHKIQSSASGPAPARPVVLPATPGIPEPPFKVATGVIHVEAESFSKMSGVRVYDCFTGGKQVNFQKNMDNSWIDYTVDVSAAGIHGMTMRVATPNRDQVLDVSVDTNKPATVNIPNTTGLWAATEEVRLRLKKGTQTLRLSAPYQRGIALRWLDLKSQGVTQ